MERRINEDVYFLTHERDHYKSELNRYYGLPNPVGVGMRLKWGLSNRVRRCGGSTGRVGPYVPPSSVCVCLCVCVCVCVCE